MAPIDKPGATLQLIKKFINKEPLTTGQIQQTLPLELQEESSTSINVVMIVSLICNVLLVAGIVFWLVRRRLKNRQNDTWMYNAVDDRIGDNFIEIV